MFYIAIALVASIGLCHADEKPEYKMCVPDLMYRACTELVESTPSEYATIRCVAARDRMECLEKVNKREADFVAVDPEDMYVAFQMKNEDFSVFSEIRTVEEPEAEFRYEGIILVHKNSDIHSLGDLRGKKSCHTGFGRNVGYKIPITKLKKYGVLKITASTALSPLEKELKGLSDLFSKSCLVGTYSPQDDVNQMLKKRYSNLCELCEDPVKCNYPDKYSGYEGAIRCLVEQNADVAFTKVIYVRRFFGLSINNQVSRTDAQANPEDYEYLCEDGSRKPVTGTACTWAQRPWQGYMGNGDINTRVSRLQDRINEFYNAGKRSSNKEAATKLWINEKNLVVKKTTQVLPGDHLVKAQYKDVIERDGTVEQKIRLCVTNDVEKRKCETMQKAAYSRDIRPEFRCVLSADCIESVKNNQSDAAIVLAAKQTLAQQNSLVPVVEEASDDHLMIVVKKGYSNEVLQKTPVQYDGSDINARNAALKFNEVRGTRQCSGITTQASNVRVIRMSELNSLESKTDYEFVCKSDQKPIDAPAAELTDCYFDSTPPTAVFVRRSSSGHELDNLSHAFVALSEKFGRGGKIEDVFELFGKFEADQKDVLFSDNGSRLIATEPGWNNKIQQDYARLQCV